MAAKSRPRPSGPWPAAAPTQPSPTVANLDRNALQEWYRHALRGRVAELESLRPALARGDATAEADARLVGQALRGSGGSFGFPGLSEAGRLLEEAPADAVVRRHEATLHLLRELAWPEDPRPHAWLYACVGARPGRAETLAEAWSDTAGSLGVAPLEVAARVAAALGVLPPEPLIPSPGALRLVPPYLVAARGVLPLHEDGVAIRVATSNPLDLAAEAEIQRVSGRTPMWVVVPPTELAAAVGRIQDESGGGALRASGVAGMIVDPARAPILVVDDDVGSRSLARAVLERKGYPVLEAADGVEALERLADAGAVALAVVDLEMPGMGGRELVRALRHAPGAERTAIIVLTGTADPEVEADLMEAGADDYLRKPLDPRPFLARVSATLRRSGWTPA